MSNSMADKIKQLRISQNMTLEDVAQKVGVGKSTVRKWETGMIANMRRDKIAVLAEALNTTPAYLMGWEDDVSLAAEQSDADRQFYQLLSTMTEEEKLWLLNVIKSVIEGRK